MRKIRLLILALMFVSLYFLTYGNKPTENGIYIKCKKADNLRLCEQQEVIKVLKTRGVKNAFIAVEQLKVQDPAFGAPCHAFVHTLGTAAYNMAKKGENIFVIPLSSCGIAYIHGLMMEVVMHPNTDNPDDFSFANNLCKKMVSIAKGDTSIYYQCYHGVGHGLPLYFYTINNEEVGEIVNKSLKACENHFDGKFFCKIGVYGGISILLTGDHGLTIKDFGMEEMFDICSKSNEEIRPYCYEMSASALIFSVGDDVNKAIFYMNKYVKKDSDKIIMARQIGQAITTFKDKVTPVEVDDICNKVEGTNSHLSCIEGYMNGYVDAKAGDVSHEVLVFCSSVVFDDQETASCKKGGKLL